ncbi:MAG: DMT family transporter [Pseudomonadota bacterium]
MTMALVITTTGLLSPVIFLLGDFPSAASWPYIIASAILNNAYFFLLILAYKVGDLSHAYPLARGSAPLMVALGAAVFAGESLRPLEVLGVLVVSGAIISLMLVRGDGSRMSWPKLIYPLATGLMIASYTVVDGIGVRLSGSPAGYIGALFMLSPIPILIIAYLCRGPRFWQYLKSSWQRGVAGGVLNLGSYGLAIWALSLGAMAYVSALRETSVIIAALIGARLLHEPFGARRIVAAVMVVVGVIIMSLPSGQW